MGQLTVLRPAALEGEVLGPDARPEHCVRVTGLPNPFSGAGRIDLDLPAGHSIVELLQAALGRAPAAAHVWLGKGESPDEAVPRALWHCVRPKPGTRLSFRVVPQGGGSSMLRNMLMLGVVLAAAFFAPYLAGVLAPGLSTAGMGFAVLKGVIGLAITTIGNFLINALFPIKPPKLGSADSGASVYSISGARNQADPWGPVPVVLGRHRLYPKYAANPWTEIIGDDQYLRLLFCVGYGPLELEDLRIGTTPAAEFEGVEIEIREGWDDDLPTTLYPQQVFEQTFDIRMVGAPEDAPDPGDQNPGDWYQRTTADDISEISIDITGPRGLFRTNDSGKKEEVSISYQVEYRAVGASGWIQQVDEVRRVFESMQPVRIPYRWTVDPGQYEVRVRKNEREVNEPNHADELRWTALRGFRHAPPVDSEQPLCLVAMRVRASDQLNGTIDTFNLIATSVLPDWDAAASPPAWTERATRNPASCFRAVLQGPANARPVADEDIDLDRLQQWHESCDEEGWRFDHVRDFRASAWDALSDIASAGRAAVTLRDSRWGVMIYDPDAPVVQHFTPRNSWGFSSQRAYREFPHAWRVRFVNQDNDWQQDERIVYDAGYDQDNATRFEALEFPGVSVPDNIWRHGRFHLAQAQLRPETYSFNADFEHLLCTRGDRIRFSHDVPLFGGGAGRIAHTYDGGLTVPLDDIVTMLPDTTYCIRFRTADGASLLFSVVTEAGEQRSVTLVDPGSSPLELPQAGDLWMFGELGSESVDLAVLAIEPGPDLSARLVCVDWAPEIADADQGEIPAFDSQVSEPFDARGAIPPGDLRFAEALVRAGPAIQAVGSLSWTKPAVSGPVDYEVQHRISGGIWQAGIVTGGTMHQFVNLDGAAYDFRVRALGPDNSASSWAVLSGQTIEGLLAAPQDVAQFRCHIIGSMATLSWTPVPDLDLSHYEIRFQPVTTGVQWQNALVLAANYTGTSLQTAAMVGTWLIKAVDTSGVYSDSATLIVSSVAGIEGLNVVELLDEAAPSPAFAGTADPDSVNVAVDGDSGALQLADVDVEITEDAPSIEGVYMFAQIIDLGQVYTSRLTGVVGVTGVDLEDDVFARADWFAVEDYFGGLIDGYEVDLQVRWTDGDPSASPVAWSDWTSFLVMDVTARAIHPRLLLTSYDRHVTPRVSVLSVEVDMLDRVAAAEDVTAPDTGLSVTFTPAFRATPAVAVTVQDGATGDYAEITAKSETGFSVIVRNSGGTGVERVVDWIAKGYGVKV